LGTDSGATVIGGPGTSGASHQATEPRSRYPRVQCSHWVEFDPMQMSAALAIDHLMFNIR
jgi:hypothetical protein